MAIKPGRYDPMKPDVELFDYKSKKRYGLKLTGGSSSLQVGTISQDDTVYLRNAAKRIGDFDEQRSWKGGRGVETLSSNAEAYWDSQNTWTLSDGHLYPTLLWQMAKGLRSSDLSLPSKTAGVTWKQLFSASRYISTSFVSSGVVADYARMWVRRVGTPGVLTINLCSDNSGSPGSVLKTVSINTSDVTDVISRFVKFDWTSTQTLVSGTTYHIVIFGDSSDNKNNHWDVGCMDGGTGKASTDNSTWSNFSASLYYYIVDADVSRKFFPFFLDSAMYLVDSKDDKVTASKLYINGDRGKATSAASTFIKQTGKTWTVNRWAGAFMKIVRGTGSGQTAEILSNTNDTITFSALTVSPSTDSEYIIYATEWFTEVTTTGLGVVTSSPCVVNQIVYFPQGSSVNIRRMVWDPATPAHTFSDDGTNKADFLIKYNDQYTSRIFSASNTTGSGGGAVIDNAAAVTWAASPTNLTFGAATRFVGEGNSKITGICEAQGVIYIFKEDGVWSWANQVLVSMNTGIEKTPDSNNGTASIAHQQFVYYNWMHSVIRIYGSSQDDIGQDWSGYGLPEGREGTFSAFDSYTSLLFAAVDAGSTGTSSVLAWDGIFWHEAIQAFDVGRRIRMVKVQPCFDTRNRTWVDMGGDLVYQEMPFKKGSPRLDSGVRYMHECVLESSAIDMGTASGLPKFIKELTVTADNLGDGNEIYVDYQIDDDVHTNNWTEATGLFQSPESTAFLGLNNIRKFAYRLRIQSRDNATPTDVRGVVPNGYARSPYKMVWTLQCRADNITSRGRLVKPDVLMRWLLDNARMPGRVEMKSQYELAHKFFVIIHPPRMFPYKPSANGQAEESIFTLTLEEA